MSTGKTYSLSVEYGEDRIVGLINSLNVGVILQGPDTGILFSNNAALDMLGLSEDELYGRSSLHPAWNVIHEDGKPFPGPEHPVPAAIRSRKPIKNIVMGVYRPATADRIWLLVDAIPVLDETGAVQEVICSFIDITERKKAEEKLSRLYNDLEARAVDLAASNADLEKFVYVATHDLQEPLRRITGFVQLLEKKFELQLDEQSKEYIRYAVEGSARMKKLILDLLEYARFSSSREQFTQTDISKVLDAVKRNFTSELTAAGASLEYGPMPVVHSEKRMMTQLFENLVCNAIKYRSAEPLRIRIECTEEPHQYRFRVTDNGIGISSAYSGKIFNLFQRLHHNGTYEGTGVGLAICQKIVHIHQGKIGVEPGPARGSSFWFTIPKLKKAVHEEL